MAIPMLEQRIPGTQDYIKRFNFGPGKCAWCGAERRAIFHYRLPGSLDYRMPVKGTESAWCNRECFKSWLG